MDDFDKQLTEAIEAILASADSKKLIVAGPGTGKTHLFKLLLEKSGGNKHTRLALTFLTNLERELNAKLSSLAGVYTLHGFCQRVLHQNPELRGALTDRFSCLPGMASLIKEDWQLSHSSEAPKFGNLLRGVAWHDQIQFYFTRSEYYDAVDFDDSIFRLLHALQNRPDQCPTFHLVLVDEYQDFNEAESALVELLGEGSPIVVVGDDDQALYSLLRGATHEFIRRLHKGGEYKVFALPFCLRCPLVVVNAFHDVLAKAQSNGNLRGRIDKPFHPFPPLKGADSERYSKIKLVETSVQRKDANYMTKYIEHAIHQIPQSETEKSRAEGFPTVLIIGSKPFLPQVIEKLIEDEFEVEHKDPAPSGFERSEALRMLKAEPEANRGWRIVLGIDRPKGWENIVRRSVSDKTLLFSLLDPTFRDSILKEANSWEPLIEEPKPAEEETIKPTILATTFEGSKGLSAQHVFVIGLQQGVLPKNGTSIDDLEVCKFLVALTRTRMECHLLYTKNFAGKFVKPSEFLSWIGSQRVEVVRVNKDWPRG